MARISLLSGLVKVTKKVIPERWLKRYDAYLYSAGIGFLAAEYLTVTILFAVLLGLVVALLNPLYGIGTALAVGLGIGVFYPYWRTAKRIEDMERTLPDAFFYLASSLRAGISFSEALEELTTARFGALTDEFKKTVSEIKKGRPTIEALRAFAFRNRKSKVIYRSMMIVIEAFERGAPMADVLVAVANDVREILRIQRERKSSTGMQTMFFIVASGAVGPMILGILPKIMSSMTASGTFTLPIDTIKLILLGFVVLQAIVSGLGIGVIREGKFSAGLKYSGMLVVMGVVVFQLIGILNIGF
ncbi:type II secretion system F family protein [Palaeococcus ferrophilus]|uniref:type II secretion system F family protein n=1 Tax=Palaeococcus ferrophilus TaxID=83868 RepID=UPI00064EA0B9|nr:type II secretion system F family protein [Palaeococcus ferrophilus]